MEYCSDEISKTMSLEVDFDTVKMVNESWDQVKKIPNYSQVAGEICSIFRIAPGAWAMFPFGKGYDRLDDAVFASSQFASHARSVVGMLDTAVHFLGPDLSDLEETLVTLGAHHVGFGVMPEHYPIVGQALIETLATALGDEFTSALKAAWTGVYGFVTQSMLKGANESLLRLRMDVYGSKHSVTLDECVTRMLPGQKEIYFVTTIEQTLPHDLDRLIKAGVTVLSIDPQKADLVVTNLAKYVGRKMVDVAATSDKPLNLDFLDPSVLEVAKGPPSPASVIQMFQMNGLDLYQAEDFCVWFRATLGPAKVVACTPTCRFGSLPARVIQHEGQNMQALVQKLEDFDCMPLPKKHVEINPSHQFIMEIQKARSKHPAIAAMMAEQVLDNCLINAGLLDDCRGMVNRMTDISMLLLECKNKDTEA